MTSTRAMTLILAACIAFPSTAATAAQTPENAPTTQTPENAPTPVAKQTGRAAALEHLAEAERLLSSIPQDLPNLKKDGRQKIAELRNRFAQLASAYRANGDPFVPAAVIQDADVKDENRNEEATTNWKMLFSDVESDLTAILGGGASLPPSTPAGTATTLSGAPGAVGTSGTSATVPEPIAAPGTGADTQPTSTTPLQGPVVTAVVGDIGIKDLDPEIRRVLEQFRLELELFFGETTMNFESETTR